MTPHFTVALDPKLTCSCGCGMLPPQDFMDRVERARVLCEKMMRDDGYTSGFAWRVVSGARCPTYNAKVSATQSLTGPHTKRAIDIGVSHVAAYYAQKALYMTGFTGIGVNQKGGARFLHGDDLPDAPGQPRPHLWSY
jgi:hypothetical protein